MNPALLALILTQAQVGCLNSAYNAGELYGLAKTFRAVVLVESSGCVNELGDDGRSVGPAQIQIQTAAKICGYAPDSNKLATDRAYNLQCGARFLSACFTQFWPDKRRALLCYGTGIPEASKALPSEVAKSKYVDRVLRAEKQLAQVRLDRE